MELILLLRAGQYIGVFNTIMIVLFTGITGAFLAKSQGIKILSRIQKDIECGIMPTDKLLDGVFVLIGGIVLLTPGFITDFTGFILLIPFTRNIIKKWLKKKLKANFTIRSSDNTDTYIDV